MQLNTQVSPEDASLRLVNSMAEMKVISCIEKDRGKLAPEIHCEQTVAIVPENEGLDLLSDEVNHCIFYNDNVTVMKEQQVGIIPKATYELTFVLFQRNRPVQRSNFEGGTSVFRATYYIRRILKYSGASPSCMLVSMIYLKRFKCSNPSTELTSRTMQRLILVASMTSSKFLDDNTVTNSRWYVEITPVSAFGTY